MKLAECRASGDDREESTTRDQTLAYIYLHVKRHYSLRQADKTDEEDVSAVSIFKTSPQ